MASGINVNRVMCCEREILKIIIDLGRGRGRGRVNREWCKLL